MATDKELYNLQISIQKAVNGLEAPLKVKHARAIIISTFRNAESSTLWEMLKRQPLMEQRFTAWKFCHLVHKVLREGHSSIIKVSHFNRNLITQIGAMWMHLNDGVGVCIEMYTKLLVTKIEFHKRNPAIPGSLVLEFNELEKYAHNDINYYFEIGVEVFDYLDDILSLQSKVFLNIQNFRMSSMSPQGQCRLAPLIPLIQDSNQLYDLIVRLMFKLHANLPNDILQGHRERFRVIFCKLKEFYNTVKPLAYFADLIQVPTLPEVAPNFSSKVDFGSYVPPVVIVPEVQVPDPEPENLIDTNIPIQSNQSENNFKKLEALKAEYEQELRSKDQYVQQLHGELQQIRSNHLAVLSSTEEEIKNLKLQNQLLADQLNLLENDLLETQNINSRLESSANSQTNLEEKLQTEEEKHKAIEEKFLKMKTCYGQIRDEHVQLLRKNAETSKKNSSLQSEITKLNSDIEIFKSNLEEYREKENKSEIIFKKSVELEQVNKTIGEECQNAREELKCYKEKFEKVNCELTELNDRYNSYIKDQDIKLGEKDNQCTEMTKNLNELESKNSDLMNEINRLKENIELLEKNNESMKTSINVDQSKLTANMEEITKLESKLQQTLTEKLDIESVFDIELKESSKKFIAKELQCEELRNQLEICNNERCDLIQQLEVKSTDFEALKESNLSLSKLIQEQKSELEIKEQQYNLLIVDNEQKEKALKLTKSNVDRLLNEKNIIENEFQDLLHQQTELESKITLQSKTISELNAGICALLSSVITSSEQLTLYESDTDINRIFHELNIKIKELSAAYSSYEQNPKFYAECLGRKIITTGHFLGILQERGLEICNNCPDIQAGEKIAGNFENITVHIHDLFESIKKFPPYDVLESKFEKLTLVLDDLFKATQSLTPKDNRVQISDQLEMELASMDKAIEEASRKISDMLLNSRSQDSGIILEVNEKILDSCTKLIQSIMLLVQKSKLLQFEIVKLGKGTASAKDFYKRNNQWTDGLISAAKNVGIGANLLVEAANKAVSGETKHKFDIIAAAQEIAASTTQLVVASRVKAPKESKHLTELSTASKTVSQATGEVVATVRDCSQRLDNNEDFDITKLTVHQVKTMEMEIQVKVLELEQSLQMERQKLAAFRRKSYNFIDDN